MPEMTPFSVSIWRVIEWCLHLFLPVIVNVKDRRDEALAKNYKKSALWDHVSFKQTVCLIKNVILMKTVKQSCDLSFQWNAKNGTFFCYWVAQQAVFPTLHSHSWCKKNKWTGCTQLLLCWLKTFSGFTGPRYFCSNCFPFFVHRNASCPGVNKLDGISFIHEFFIDVFEFWQTPLIRPATNVGSS